MGTIRIISGRASVSWVELPMGPFAAMGIAPDVSQMSCP